MTEQQEQPRGLTRQGRIRLVALGLGLVLLFAAVVAIGLQVMRGTLRPVDYLVLGTVATLLCLVGILVLFLGIDHAARSGFFSKRRTRD